MVGVDVQRRDSVAVLFWRVKDSESSAGSILGSSGMVKFWVKFESGEVQSFAQYLSFP